MSVKELKEALQLNSTHFLNVYFASSVREELAGAATWPWDKEALSHLGKQANLPVGPWGRWLLSLGGVSQKRHWTLLSGRVGEKVSSCFETKPFACSYRCLGRFWSCHLQFSPSVAGAGVLALNCV